MLNPGQACGSLWWPSLCCCGLNLSGLYARPACERCDTSPADKGKNPAPPLWRMSGKSHDIEGTGSIERHRHKSLQREPWGDLGADRNPGFELAGDGIRKLPAEGPRSLEAH